MRIIHAITLLSILFPAARQSAYAEQFELRDGDRVVLLGNTLIERAATSGYFETVLTACFPKANVTFRNLGWSGDTVFCPSRAYFGKPEDGFKRLTRHIKQLKPTVIVLGYGMNAAFEGEKGIYPFLDGFERLRTMLIEASGTNPRFVVLSPLRQENLGPPLPGPTANNENFELYTEVLNSVAAEHKYEYIDLYHRLGDGTKADPPHPLTSNSIHLTPYGYRQAAAVLADVLATYRQAWDVRIDTSTGKIIAGGTEVTDANITSKKTTFRTLDRTLPFPPPPQEAPAGVLLPGIHRVLKINGLAPGRYTLRIDDAPVATAPAKAWAKGVELTRGPEFDQVEKLRAIVIAKNRLYFNEWRPQNETYIFGFRKHEQGHLKREIPEFVPFVVEKEKEIAALRVPASHRYELIPE